jgi:hypothetical protein
VGDGVFVGFDPCVGVGVDAVEVIVGLLVGVNDFVGVRSSSGVGVAGISVAVGTSDGVGES